MYHIRNKYLIFWKSFCVENSLHTQVILNGIIASRKELILPPHSTSGETQALRGTSRVQGYVVCEWQTPVLASLSGRELDGIGP